MLKLEMAGKEFERWCNLNVSVGAGLERAEERRRGDVSLTSYCMLLEGLVAARNMWLQCNVKFLQSLPCAEEVVTHRLPNSLRKWKTSRRESCRGQRRFQMLCAARPRSGACSQWQIGGQVVGSLRRKSRNTGNSNSLFNM